VTFIKQVRLGLFVFTVRQQMYWAIKM